MVSQPGFITYTLTNTSPAPVISNLKLPLTESQLEKIKLESRKSGQTLNIHSTGSQQTSINPRQRPEDLHNNTPSVEAVMMELQKRTGSGQNLKSVQVYTVLEKLLPSLTTAGDRVKANKKNTDLVKNKYSELAEHCKKDEAALQTFKPQAQQLAACYHNQQAQLTKSIEAYKQIHQKVQILQELYAKLKTEEELMSKAFEVDQSSETPEIFTVEFPEFDENSKPVQNSFQSTEKSPKGHRRTRSETPITELAKLRLEQSKQILTQVNSGKNYDQTQHASDGQVSYQAVLNPNQNIHKNRYHSMQNFQSLVKTRATTLPTSISGTLQAVSVTVPNNLSTNSSGDTYQNLQRDLFKNQSQDQSPFDCVPGFNDNFTSTKLTNNENNIKTVDLFGAAPF